MIQYLGCLLQVRIIACHHRLGSSGSHRGLVSIVGKMSRFSACHQKGAGPWIPSTALAISYSQWDSTSADTGHVRLPLFAHSRRTFFLTFPVLVLGSSATTSTSRGTMNLLIALLFLAHAITSCPSICFPCFTVTNALGRSPQCASGTATTPASRMSGWVTSIDSRATDEMFSPPVQLWSAL